MTQQHLLGELSLILGELQAVSTNEATVREIALLRREVETGAFGALPSVTARTAICAELWEFALSAGLVEER